MTPTIPVLSLQAAPQGSGLSAVVPRAPAAVSRPQAPAPAAQDGETPLSLEAARSLLERNAQDAGAALEFRIDDDSGRVVVSVVDRHSGEVLRQIPNEEALRIAHHIQQQLHRDRGAVIAAQA
jgi:flagellar protein FlaG